MRGRPVPWLKKEINVLRNIASRRGSGKGLSFGMPHVLKALQMLRQERFVSRAAFCTELQIGQGMAKTLVAHLKYSGVTSSTKSGTTLTEKGRKLCQRFEDVVGRECPIRQSAPFQGRYNHAIVLRNCPGAIRTGVEQRDYAVRYGAVGCTTMQYTDGKFVFPGEYKDCFEDDVRASGLLHEGLSPEEGDTVIVSSAPDMLTAELSAKNAVLCTLASVQIP